MSWKIILYMPCRRGGKGRGTQSSVVLYNVSISDKHLQYTGSYSFKSKVIFSFNSRIKIVVPREHSS